MSITHESIVDCPRCQLPVRVFVADSLNAGRHPGLRAALLDGSLHRFTCVCDYQIVVDKYLLYFDHGRGHFFFTFPRTQITNLAACLAEAREVFELSFGAQAPDEVRPLAAQTMVRVCFGLDQLRDKVIADDHGLSDLVLEELKCEVLAERAELRELQVIGLWLVGVHAETLEFLTQGLDGTRPQRIKIPRAAYDEIAARGHAEILAARPSLVNGPHVSMLGMLLETA
ncbi:MAG: CpXC domain-containing protein [Proteobacteria bacterium]|nr:CpXC domain-containing protein [Pseudomonadota bacterium]